MKYAFGLLLLISFSCTAEIVLDQKEKDIVRAVDKDQPQALSLLEQVVNINSGTMNFSGVKQVG